MNVKKTTLVAQMQFAEIFSATTNATVSKIFTEIYLENASKPSKCYKFAHSSDSYVGIIFEFFKNRNHENYVTKRSNILDTF